MSDQECCLVEDCNGEYITAVIKVTELRNGKKINVVESICSVCGDDLDARLVKFIKENL